MRDALGSASYWEEWISFDERAIAQRIENSSKPAVNQSYESQYVRDLAFMHMKLLLRRYSRGDPASQLSGYFDPLLHYLEESRRLGEAIWTPEQQRTRHTWSLNLNWYIDSFWLIGLALALEISDSQWQRLVALIGNDGEDVLLDRIIATRTPNRHVGTALCYPKPYAQLMKAIDAPTASQPALLATFLEHWYEDTKSAARSGREKQASPDREPYWHGYHDPMKGAYFGYWCLEAVAAVKAFDLDDSQCLGHPHYPGDLLRPSVVTPPDLSRLSPHLAAIIDAPANAKLADEGRKISSWEALKTLIKDKLGQ